MCKPQAQQGNARQHAESPTVRRLQPRCSVPCIPEKPCERREDEDAEVELTAIRHKNRIDAGEDLVPSVEYGKEIFKG